MFENRVKKLLFALAVILGLTPLTAAAAQDVINESQLDQSVILIDYDKKEDVKTVVRISKGQQVYDYDLIAGVQYPLQMGNGQYTILVGEAAEGNKFKVVAMEDVHLNQSNENTVFLQSNIVVDWNEQTKAVLTAQELVKDLTTDTEKMEVIYQYVINNYAYDYEKAKTVEAGYLPNLDLIYDIQLGICYDYAAMMASMLRSVGIPAKLLMGYQVEDMNVYHAWNQVYLSDSNQWVTIDTTYDAIRVQNGQAVNMVQDSGLYLIEKIY